MTIKFLGASVRSVNSQAGWDTSGPSQLNISLVEDPTDGDLFTPGTLLRPVYFSMGDFTFNGLLQRYHKREDQGGYPTYEVVVVDPREILDGAKIILGGYSGSVGGIPNLLNVYGWWESQEFGAAQSDETGMPWTRVLTALAALCGSPAQGTYGGPLNFHGYTYGLDLSQLPTTSPYYRVGNNLHVSLLELISQICEDHGCNFIVELVGTTIRVKTISRILQPPLGTLTSLANATRGTTLIRSETGLEGRNEVTTSFLFGGDVRVLHQTSSFASYWGNDAVGSPILGTNTRLDLVDSTMACTIHGGTGTNDILLRIDFPLLPVPVPRWLEFNVDNPTTPIEFDLYVPQSGEVMRVRGALVVNGNEFWVTRGRYSTTPSAYPQNTTAYLSYASIFCEYMVLNSLPVSDILGSITYPCTTFELRLVKATNGMYAWSSYMQHFRPDIAAIIGLLPPLKNQRAGGRALPQDLLNEDIAVAQAIFGDAWIKAQRFYEWLKGYADEYMGKKFAVSLPLVQHKQNAETLRISTSYEIDEGGWLEDGATPLGLSTLNQDVFKTQDGRFRAFAVYSSVIGKDFSLASPSNTVLEDSEFYTAMEVDPNLCYTPTPAAVVTISNPLFDSPVDWPGDIEIIRAVLQLPQTPESAHYDNRQNILQSLAHGNIGLKIAPAHVNPVSFAIPLRSNIATYGPWYVAGAPGKVHVEQDQNLVPWNYGGYSLMSTVATARVTSAATNALVIESGIREEVGLPTASLGDVLQAGGPNITGIQIQYSERGYSTQYSFSTFTPFNRGGIYSRTNQERVRRLALTQVQLRKAIRAVTRGNIGKRAQLQEAIRANKAFFGNAPKALKKESPHDVLVANTFYDDLTQKTRTGVATATAEELVGGVHADNATLFQRTAAMSLNGLLRPFSTDTTSQSMSAYTTPSTNFDGPLSQTQLNPWKAQNDIEFVAYGDSYTGLHAYRRGGDLDKTRALGLRGPLVVAGWGYDLEGNPVPNSGGSFPGNHLHEPHTWKAGPVDLLWDSRRGVWTSHDVLKGVAQTSIAGGASGAVQIYKNETGTSWDLTCYNWGTTPVSSGTKVMALYNVLDNRWYMTAGDLAGTGSSSGSSTVLPSSIYSFHQPEFIVNTGQTPWTVQANWGSGTLPIGWSSLDGSGELFARYDHTHQHPVFSSGNLHPEYKLPVPSGGAAASGSYGYFLSISNSGTYLWHKPTSLVQVGAAIPNTCLYSGVLMNFQTANGSGCCWNSGEPVYFTYLDTAHSGNYTPSMMVGYHNNRPIYSSLGTGQSGVQICQPTIPASGYACSICSNVSEHSPESSTII